jgi:transposase
LRCDPGLSKEARDRMFLKRIARWSSGKTLSYWALVESYRTARGPRHRVVSYLGELSAAERKGWARLLDRCQDPSVFRQRELFEQAAEDPVPDRVLVDVGRVRVERVRDFGEVWLALVLWQRLGLDRLLSELLPRAQEEIDWATMVCLLVVARFCRPSSELHIADTWYRGTALEELLGVAIDKVNPERLYRTLDRVLPLKPKFEAHLRQRLGELFPVSFDLLLYDVTSTYFEGQCEKNPQAQRGHSRDHRPDCKQVCIGLVVTREGLPLGYEVFAGNKNDVKTLTEIVEAIEAKYGRAERIWVFDRGIVSEENLEFLRNRQGRYVVGTPKAMLRKFERELVEQGWEEVTPGVEVKRCMSPDGEEIFILAKSRDRAAKEQAIHERFVTRIEAGLQAIQAAAASGRLKDPEQAGRRIGRLLGSNSRGAGCFDVHVKTLDPPQGKIRLSIEWTKQQQWQDWARLTEGCYLLRSNLQGHEAAELWRTYMQLVDAEAAFRTQKSELVLRPIWHQHENRVQAHILVCFLAYVLWKTLEQWMQASGLGSAPRTLLNELSRLKSTDVILPTAEGREVRLRCVSRPEPDLAVLLYRLGIAPPSRLQPPQWVPKEILARADAAAL